jgi:hypothetical protein
LTGGSTDAREAELAAAEELIRMQLRKAQRALAAAERQHDVPSYWQTGHRGAGSDGSAAAAVLVDVTADLRDWVSWILCLCVGVLLVFRFLRVRSLTA